MIEGDRIAEIRNAAEGVAPDASAACITPGMVNAHVHMIGSGEPNTMSAVALMNQNQMMLAAVANAAKSLRAGVTTVRDLGSPHGIAPALRDAIDAGAIPARACALPARVLCMTGGHGWWVGAQVDGPWDARKAVREQLRAGADCIKMIATGGVLTQGCRTRQRSAHARRAARPRISEAHRTACASPRTRSARERDQERACAPASISIEHGHMLDDEAHRALQNASTLPRARRSTRRPAFSNTCRTAASPQFVVEKAKSVSEAMLQATSVARSKAACASPAAPMPARRSTSTRTTAAKSS